MNKEMWHNIFKNYIELYEAIKTLQKSGIIKEEVISTYEHELLINIIETMKLEVEY